MKITQKARGKAYPTNHLLYTKAFFPPRSHSMSGSLRHSIGVADIQHPKPSKKELKRKKEDLDHEWIEVGR